MCSANAHHRQHTEVAAGRVAYILCKKPVATMLADAQAIITVCQRPCAKLQIAFPVRFTPAIQAVRTMLQAEGVQCRMAPIMVSMLGAWFVDPAQAGGAVMDHTVHVLDLLRWFWRTEVTEMYDEIGWSLFHPELDIDEYQSAFFSIGQ